jgi:hypothetical protein
MAELTPEERERIYQEEKARVEARRRIEEESYVPPKRLRNPLRYCCLLWAAIFFVIPAIYMTWASIAHR